MAKVKLTTNDQSHQVSFNNSTNWDVIGTNGTDNIHIEAGAAVQLELLTGSDQISFAGNMADYTVHQQGTTVYFTYITNGATVSIGAKLESKSIVFGDGTQASLLINKQESTINLDSQIITESPESVEPVPATPDPTPNSPILTETVDWADSAITSGEVLINTSVAGSISPSGEHDWIGVDLPQAYYAYVFDLEGEATNAGTLVNPQIARVLDSNSNRAAVGNDDGGEGTNARLTFTPTTAGTYYIDVSARSIQMEGSYTLTVTANDDYLASSNTSGSVPANSEITGEIHAVGDIDWIEVQLDKADSAYVFDMKGIATGDGTLADPHIHAIYDGNSKFLVYGDWDSGIGTNAKYTFTPNKSGTYYVAVSGMNNSTGTYTFALTDTDDYVASAVTTGEVTVGSATTGVIDAVKDRDWIEVKLDKSHNAYVINMEGVSTGQGTLEDPNIAAVYDSSSNNVRYSYDDNSGHGTNAQLTFTPQSAGTYYIEVSGSGDNFTGSYTVSVVDNDDYTSSTNTSGMAVVGNEVIGNIHASGDRDWIAVQLDKAKNAYVIDLEALSTNKGTLDDPVIYNVYNADSKAQARENNDSGDGTNAKLTFTPSTAGLYYIEVGGKDTRTGDYTLTVSDEDDFTSNSQTSGFVPVGGSLTGEIHAVGDHDWVKVDLIAGNSYSIAMEGLATNRGTLEDPQIYRLYSENGNTVQNGDQDSGEGTNALVEFTPTNDGTYFIELLGNTDAITGSYTLSLSLI